MRKIPDSETTVVCFALEAESGAFVRRLTGRKRFKQAGFALVHGWLNECEILVVHTGVGSEKVRQAIESGILATPKRLISAGFAGALVPELKLLQVIFPSEVRDETHTCIPLETPPAVGNSDSAGNPERLLTSSRLLGTPEEKHAAHQQHGATVVDMETFFLADYCRQHAIPFRSVRVISDTVEQSLLSEITQPTFGAQLLAAFLLVLRHPSRLWELCRLQKTARAGARLLADVLGDGTLF